MNRLFALAPLTLALAGASLAASPPSPADQEHGNRRILSFHTMYGVDGPFVGDANPVRDVIGDELPWTVEGFVIGDFDSRGHLTVLVRGLVFADDPSVPPELVGTNDEAEFRALVSCLTETDAGVETQNVITDGFHADVHGNSFIHTTIELPNPCVAPIVMILAGSEDKWFAMTGFESEGDDEGGDETPLNN
ncbi:MAG TPA: hypothetical protein VKB52_08355 [Rhodanobacteraceae bacterium]|nr:hypothetical protein [Rhodanobacteraceae bacterium]